MGKTKYFTDEEKVLAKRLKQQRYYVKNKEKENERVKKYRENNKELVKEKTKNYRKKNKIERYVYQQVYREINKETIAEKRRTYIKTKYDNDIVFKLSIILRQSVTQSFKNKKHNKSSKTVDILGCQFSEFKNHLESLWEPWMNWDNYGLYNGELNYGWDVDHIIPMASAITEEDVIRLNHYSNLQPLCSYTNRCVKRDMIL